MTDDRDHAPPPSGSLVDADAEREVLAVLAMHGPDGLAVIRDLITGPQVFTALRRQQAEVLIALASEGTPGHSPVIVRARAMQLGYTGLGDTADEWLATLLLGHVAGLSHAEHYARIVAELASRRALLDAATSLTTLAHDRAVRPEVALGQLVDRITTEVRGVAVDSTRDCLVEALEDLERDSQGDGGPPGLPSGLDALDAITDGWVAPRLVVIAGRPGYGKTATGLWCADVAARVAEAETVFVSCEQPTRQLQKRRLAMRTGIDLRGLRNRERYAERLPTLMAEAQAMREEPLTFVQGTGTVREIRLELQRLIARGRQPKLVVVDYLGKLRAEGKVERHDLGVGQITSNLCRLALDLECAVILLAQLNRESVKDGKGRRPVVSDLRDSGIIEQDADQIILLWPGAPSEDDLQVHRDGIAPFEMLLDKNRHGPKGAVRLDWWEATGRFEVPAYLPRVARFA